MKDIELQAERKAFEAWYEAYCMPSEADWFRRDVDDESEYHHAITSDAWAAWQARAIESAATAPLLARIAELKLENAELVKALEEARKQMEAQKDEWLSWEAKRRDLEKDAERYRRLRHACCE